MRFSRPMWCALAVAAVTWSCGGGDDGGTDVEVTTLTSISVGSSALNVAAGATQSITASGIGSNGSTMNGVAFTYVSGSPGVAFVSSTGTVLGLAAGASTITVTGTAGGVSKTTTVVATVTGVLPTSVTVVASASGMAFSPSLVAVARGGTVNWTFPGTEHNVTFATSGAPANIPNTQNSATPIPRTFAVAGTFNYSCTIHPGMNGTVVVP